MIYKTIKNEFFDLTFYVLSNYEDINPNRKRPMIVICPGGAYRFCSQRESESVAVKFCSFGFNTAILRYTCNKEENPNLTIYPKPQQELADAVAYIREHSDELNTNPGKIAVMGFSAGGHLACSLGCLWEKFNKNARPDAMILCYPVITCGPFAHKGSFINLCGSGNDLKKDLSLENKVTENTPPTYLWHTSTDQSVPVENSLLFKEALDKKGIPNELHLFSSGSHGLSLATKEVCNAKHPETNEEVSVWPELVKEWLIKLFGDDWY